MLISLVIVSAFAIGAEAGLPNIVIMLADDMGWGDWSRTGAPADTPHLEAMSRSKSAVWFQRAYSGNPICSPTRASVLTGRTPARSCIYAVEQHILCRDGARGCARGEVGIANLTRQHGYVSGFYGKWHLGSLSDRGVGSPDCYEKPAGVPCQLGYWQKDGGCCFGVDGPELQVSHPLHFGFDAFVATPECAASATSNCGCFFFPSTHNDSACELGHYAVRSFSRALSAVLSCTLSTSLVHSPQFSRALSASLSAPLGPFPRCFGSSDPLTPPLLRSPSHPLPSSVHARRALSRVHAILPRRAADRRQRERRATHHRLRVYDRPCLAPSRLSCRSGLAPSPSNAARASSPRRPLLAFTAKTFPQPFPPRRPRVVRVPVLSPPCAACFHSVDDEDWLVDHFEELLVRSEAEGRPFLALLCFHGAHIPYVATPAMRARYMARGFDANEADYWGTISQIDRAVGRVRALLAAHGVANNTWLSLTSDNGPEVSPESGQGTASWANPGRTAGLRGRKRDVTEGGTRVIGLVEFAQAVFPRGGGVEASFPVSTMDLLPTIADLLGDDWVGGEGVGGGPAGRVGTLLDGRPIDGISLLPVLRGEMSTRPTTAGIGIHGSFPFGATNHQLDPATGALVVPYRCPVDSASARLGDVPSDFASAAHGGYQFSWAEGNELKLLGCNGFCDGTNCNDTAPGFANPGWHFFLYNLTADRAEATDLWQPLRPLATAMLDRFMAWQSSVLHSQGAEEIGCAL